MPAPIHPDYNFKVNHKKRDNHYSMNTAASYENMYGIGYMISGDRIIITPQKNGNCTSRHNSVHSQKSHTSYYLYF